MILLLSTSDTDLLCARASGADYRWANPARLHTDELAGLVDGVDLVIVRVLGGMRAWEDGLAWLRNSGLPLVALGGELTPDAEMIECSTVSAGIAGTAHSYFVGGGADNFTQLHNFLSDTVLLTGHGFTAPVQLPDWGVRSRPHTGEEGPRVAVVYYRAHELAGNTAFVDALCDAIEAHGAQAVAVYSASLRTASAELLAELSTADAIVVTVLAAGGSTPAAVGAGGDDTAWDVGELAKLDVPIIQGLCLTSGRQDWQDSDEGLSPLDTATQVAIPEFDGRVISVPFSFKEYDEQGLAAYVADPERAARVAGIAVRHARLAHIPVADKRVALMFSAYPTKHSRIGNAVGLDTPRSAVLLMRQMRDLGYDFGAEPVPGVDFTGDDLAQAGDELVHTLIASGGQDPDWTTSEQFEANPIRLDANAYKAWFATLPEELRTDVEGKWGPAPGTMFVDHSRVKQGEFVIAAMEFGNISLLVQPPRGFGENPVAIYHDPDLAPSHYYLAVYRWIATTFGADAVVHLGKHGNLEWLPGKNMGMSAACGTDAALGDLPLFYPFLVNDPGEGSQAKRRAHAVLIDHLVPPMARAESYGDLARLEQLLDEHQNIAAMDPAKLPAIRQQIWTLLRAAKLDHDLGLTEQPAEDSFDDMLLHVDGWLCEVKDVQIRDGLHVLGQAPEGDAELDLVLAMLRARQLWGGSQLCVGLREALGLAEGEQPRDRVDEIERQARELLAGLQKSDWDADVAATLHPDPQVSQVLTFAATEVVPRLRQTGAEVERLLHGLDGGFIPSGPSGSPLRGLINVLPTGRNFYSVDPRAVPSQLAWETGQALAESLLARYLADHGEYPASVGLSVWGTAAMRTCGDDIAEVFALLGVRPVWDPASRRISELTVIPLSELARPRIDVTVRISGFFRDAFPHVLTLLDDAVRMVASLDEPDEQNFVKAHVARDVSAGQGEREASMRIFGSKPGSYGAGLLELIDSRNWRTDADLAQVYTTWGGYAYGRDLAGESAAPQMQAAYRRIAVAAKNTDTREHDIADSDDYFQYHGGMVAAVRALTGTDPEAYIGDSTRPDAVRTRTLSQEVARVFRARVVNPRWLEAMRRHGYKGAFEMAATVDYLFGYDATTDVVADWMYEQLTDSYVLDEENREFFATSNPWALHGVAERLLEAADRQMWKNPPPDMLNELRQVYLEAEAQVEGD